MFSRGPINFFIGFLIKQRSPKFAGGFFKFTAPYLKSLPIPKTGAPNGQRAGTAKQIITLVERTVDLNKKHHSGKLALSELARVEREIAATDQEIDELVYRPTASPRRSAKSSRAKRPAWA